MKMKTSLTKTHRTQKKAVTRGKFIAVNTLIKNYKDLNSITYNSTKNWKKSKQLKTRRKEEIQI